MTTCLITGALIHDTEQDRACWADLFHVPGYYIFHLAGHKGEPAWVYDFTFNDQQKVVAFSYPGQREYFELHDYFVIPEHMVHLSPAAKDYIEKGALL